ncbi:MAG: hypothetical protein U0N82_10155 [Oscillospiraceae bacterium]
MNTPKLKITTKKYTDETAVISLRLPKDMIRDIDAVAKAVGRARNEILTMSLEFALENMEIDNSNDSAQM